MTPSVHRRAAVRRRPGLSSAIGALVLVLLGMPASAQDTAGVGAIAGVVTSAAGQPAEGVRVCALNTSSCATPHQPPAVRGAAGHLPNPGL